jgi:hypothetical protein
MTAVSDPLHGAANLIMASVLSQEGFGVAQEASRAGEGRQLHKHFLAGATNLGAES